MAVSPAITAPQPGDGLWQQWSARRLQLSDTVSVHEHRYRGRRWYLLREALSGRQYRLTQMIYRFLALLDGRRTIAEAFATLNPQADGEDRARGELLTALTQLHADGLLAGEPITDVGPVIARTRQQRRRRSQTRWLRLLSPRMPLVDPDRWVSGLVPFVKPLLSRAGFVSWLCLVAAGGLLALMHAEALGQYAVQRIDDPRSWLLLVVLYPVVKALHEIGHGLVAKAGGAEVHEMGITLLVFVPVPYVDASAATVFEDKSQRVLVSAAGIMVELGLAVLTLIAWGQLDDGLLRDAAFAVMAIGGISTLLFNGNPLLRFDGYYVLSDLIEVPNLASRAARFYAYLAQRYLLGLKSARPPMLATGERSWLVFFGAASTLFRLAISIGIAVFLITVIPTLGWLLAAWLLFAQVALPLGRQLRFLLFDASLAGRRGQATAVVGGLLAVLFGVLAFLPIGSKTQVDGVVMLPERAIVRAGADGFLERQLVGHGTRVREREPLFVLRNSAIKSEAASQRARVAEFVARLEAVSVNDRVTREIQAERLADARAELARLEERLDGLQVLSPGSGILQVPIGADQQGRLVEQGTLLAYLADQSDAQVRVIANQEQAARIRAGFDRVEVRVAGDASPQVGRLLEEVPAGSDVLPSAALGSRGGGAIQVDARDEKGRKALHRVFAFDVAIPQTDATRFIGSRAHVRFEHDASPLLARAYDGARRFLMVRLGE